ncbi:Uncharacterised protein [Mycobacteroides abscessus subsp. abscessus]|nr:Uncharacterised protein [Mycobacteroides abscessus subsp. abscessus]
MLRAREASPPGRDAGMALSSACAAAYLPAPPSAMARNQAS